MKLIDTIEDQAIRERLIADCAKLMDEQVASKNGMAGLALKTTYGVVKGVGPGYISKAINGLLPETLVALDPLWAEGLQTGDPVAYLTQNTSRTADTILSVTDARIEKSKRAVVRASYSKLRKSVKSDVEAAVPGLAQIIHTHTNGAVSVN